jgi:serine/threonine protein kinase
MATGSNFCTKCGISLTGGAPAVETTGKPAEKAKTTGSKTTGGGTVAEQNERIRAKLQEGIGDRFRLLDLLGRGGMGVVFCAKELSLDRDVALKVLTLDPTLAPDAFDRFEREAKLAARLDHPNIVPIFSVGKHNTVAYYTMRLVRGGSVEDMIGQQKKLTVKQTVPILRDVAAALDYAHARGVVHRDIKPANIMISETGHAVVADFGIAKALGGSTAGNTGSGSIIGSPGYMSPEQWRGEAVDGKADQYALGIVAYEMLTGARPFLATKVQDLIKMHLNAAPPDITTKRQGIEPHVDDAIRRALAKNAKDRFPTATAFVDALAGLSTTGVVGQLAPTLRAPKYQPKPAKKGSGIGFLFLLLPIAAFAALWYTPSTRPKLEHWLRIGKERAVVAVADSVTVTPATREDSLLEHDVNAVLSDTTSGTPAVSAPIVRDSLATSSLDRSSVYVDTNILNRMQQPRGPAPIEGGWLMVSVRGGVAQIRIDGKGSGFSDRTVKVDAGSHLVSVLGDFWPSQRDVVVVDGDTTRVVFYGPGVPRPQGDTVGVRAEEIIRPPRPAKP